VQKGRGKNRDSRKERDEGRKKKLDEVNTMNETTKKVGEVLPVVSTLSRERMDIAFRVNK